MKLLLLRPTNKLSKGKVVPINEKDFQANQKNLTKVNASVYRFEKEADESAYLGEYQTKVVTPETKVVKPAAKTKAAKKAPAKKAAAKKSAAKSSKAK